MIKTIEYSLPAYWASYLINGDCSGLEDAEKKQIDSFMKSHRLETALDFEEQGFAWGNDATKLGCDVATFTFEHKVKL